MEGTNIKVHTSLEACPFCGCTHRLRVEGYSFSEYRVLCDNCKVSGPPTKTVETATRLWNERLNPRMLPPHVEVPEPKTEPRAAPVQAEQAKKKRRGRRYTDEQRKAASERMKRLHREGKLRKAEPA